jgi:dTDP-glucose 4,6-dehydratase
MKILVTGDQGTLGRLLVKELRKRGHEVWGCDLCHQRDDNYIRADISSFRQLERVFEQDYDYVYHQAAES